jgi:hypothetical protein
MTSEGDARYVIGLAFLAPDLTATILAGRQPRHVTAERLLRTTRPLAWAEQRKRLCFPA